MATNKSPGLDGLPAEFYTTFWNTLGEDMVEVFNSCYHVGLLPFSQRSGVISLLYKKGDIVDTGNWRPITLLCADYKIVAKALANRLLRVIASVISPDQSCGIPGRFMGENVRLLCDVVQYANLESVPAAILSLDQAKAFDRVDWSFLRKVLAAMGFGPSFQRWVSLLYTSVFSAVNVNGFLTEAFPVTRGVRQGCPLSPLLYVLVAETIACKVRAHPCIDGFPLPGGRTRVKITQYADDTTVLVASDSSIIELFKLFSRYERASGAKLNPTKCHGLLVGPWKTRSPASMPVTLQWSSLAITVLGCRISNDGSEDWGSLLGQLTTALNAWKHRNLSFRGRAIVANTLGLSTLWYRATVVPIPAGLITQVNKVIFPYVWNKKTELLARTSLTQPLHKGGLGVVDVSRKVHSLRVLWVKRFIFGVDRHWQAFFRHFLRRAFLAEPVERVFHFSSIGPASFRRLPVFYREVLAAWLTARGAWLNDEWAFPRSGSSPALPLRDATAKIVYSLLGDINVPTHRCVAKFQSLNIDWTTVWSDLQWLRFCRSALDTSWLVAHGVLPTCDRLLRFGMSVNPRCHCGANETLHHLFCECPLALQLIGWLFGLLRIFRPRLARLSSSTILFGFRNVDSIPAGFVALLGIVRHRLWCARNLCTFEGIRPNAKVVLDRVKSTFRFVSRIQQRHSQRFSFGYQWLGDGALGSVKPNGSIAFVAALS